MNSIDTVSVKTISALAMTTDEKEEIKSFGIPITNDKELAEILEEEQTNQRKDAVRAAARQLINLDKVAVAHLQQQFNAIKLLNRELAAARRKVEKTTLARAYGAETRNYMPLAFLLGSVVSGDDIHLTIIPAEWIAANSQRVLTAFRKDAETAKKTKKSEK